MLIKCVKDNQFKFVAKIAKQKSYNMKKQLKLRKGNWLSRQILVILNF